MAWSIRLVAAALAFVDSTIDVLQRHDSWKSSECSRVNLPHPPRRTRVRQRLAVPALGQPDSDIRYRRVVPVLHESNLAEVLDSLGAYQKFPVAISQCHGSVECRNRFLYLWIRGLCSEHSCSSGNRYTRHPLHCLAPIDSPKLPPGHGLGCGRTMKTSPGYHQRRQPGFAFGGLGSFFLLAAHRSPQCAQAIPEPSLRPSTCDEIIVCILPVRTARIMYDDSDKCPYVYKACAKRMHTQYDLRSLSVPIVRSS
jgi:hypothetical protein